jgi:hypothetical protein
MLIRAISGARYPAPRHHGMFAVDIASFGCRNPRIQLLLRDRLYAIVQEACDAAGICWQRCHHEDRGDGFFAVAPGDVSIETLMDPFVRHLRIRLRDYNAIMAHAAQIQLRMAIHAGYVYTDRHGITGRAVIHLFRLMEAPVFKAELAHRHADFALIVSDYLHEEIIGDSPGQIGPGSFQSITVDLKETRSRGWIWLTSPGRASQPYPHSLD